MPRALVVDDSRAMRMVVRRIMESFGFDVVDAADGQIALDLLRADPDVDVALIDWHMPNLDGVALITAMHEERELFRIRTVMVSAETDVRRVMQALRAGADEYLMKPVTAEALAEKLTLLGFSVATAAPAGA